MHIAAGQSYIDLIPFLLAVLVMPVLSVYGGRKIGTETPLMRRYGFTLLRGVAVTILLLLYWQALGRPLATLGLDMPVSMIGLAMLALVGVVAIVFVIQLLRLPRTIKPEQLERLRTQIREIRILPRTTPELLVFLLVAIMAGIWEELLFRGFLIWFLTPYATVWGAVILSTVVFALGHLYQGWKGIPRSGGIGLLLAIGYVLSGSLWWLMALHALVDLFGGIAAWRATRLMPD